MRSRFYFHLVSPEQRVVDRVGLELVDETAIWREPLKLVNERWPGTVDPRIRSGWSVEIVDAAGRVVLLMPLDELD